MKVKVKEYVQTIYELPDDYFDKLINDDMSDCEIAYEFKTKGKEIKEVECGKRAHLHITLKDGRVITEDGCNYGEVDMKWASEEHLYDEKYGELI